MEITTFNASISSKKPAKNHEKTMKSPWKPAKTAKNQHFGWWSEHLPTDRAVATGSGRQGRRSGALRRDLRQLGEALVAAQWADQHQAFLRKTVIPIAIIIVYK